ncbi:MAG: PKD domain-containing protein [Candidatus Thermoplasmatota archaeon]|nr:PKD domain-containing protein [Candidatus Thermoplasmatota archaeon]
MTRKKIPVLGMEEKTYGMIWGTVAIVLGLVILLFVFSQAYEIVQNPSEKLDEWVPKEIEGPTASFSWVSHDTSVTFNDDSKEGDGKITSWHWDFDDSSSSNERNPRHDYSDYGEYTVSLEVEDENGKSSSVDTIMHLEEGSNNGHTEEGFPFDLGIIGNVLERFVIVGLLTGLFAVLVMIGGRITMAGVHLLRPMPKTFKVKVKPRDMEVEIPSKQIEENQPEKQT